MADHSFPLASSLPRASSLHSANRSTTVDPRQPLFNNMLWASPTVSPKTQSAKRFASSDASLSPRSSTVMQTVPAVAPVASTSTAPAPSVQQPRISFRRISKRKNNTEFDFGCAGDSQESSWTLDAAEDMSDRIYSTSQGMNRRSMASNSTHSREHSSGSSNHSRAHSSSSVRSSMTNDSSIPPSPTLSSYSKESHGYKSRVPLSPLAAERSRSRDEILGVEAVHDYFGRMRLSRVDEVIDSRSPRASFDAATSPGRLTLRRTSSAPTPGDESVTASIIEDENEDDEEGFVISFAPTTESTFTPALTVETLLQNNQKQLLSPSMLSSASGHSTIIAASPATNDAHMSRTLDELSEYFSRHGDSPIVPPTTSFSVQPERLSSISDSTIETKAFRKHAPRPRLTGNLTPGLSPSTCDALRLAPERRRVQYGWI